MKLTEREYQKYFENKKPILSKYNAQKIKYDGIVFDSKKEGLYYLKLVSMSELGLIKELELQKVFELQPKFKKNNKTYRAIKYIADFYFYDNELKKYRVIDTKGFRTETFKLKKKMFEYRFEDLEIEEV